MIQTLEGGHLEPPLPFPQGSTVTPTPVHPGVHCHPHTPSPRGPLSPHLKIFPTLSYIMGKCSPALMSIRDMSTAKNYISIASHSERGDENKG